MGGWGGQGWDGRLECLEKYKAGGYGWEGGEERVV